MIGLDADGEYIDFGALAATGNLTQKTICAWVYPTSDPPSGVGYIWSQYVDAPKKGFGFSIANFASPILVCGLWFFEYRSTTAGVWYCQNAYTLGVWNFVAVTYDASSVAYDPVFYSGLLIPAVTEYMIPAGSRLDFSSLPVWVGDLYLSDPSPEHLQLRGYVQDVRVYSRILSAAEIQTIYNSRCMTDNDFGLVFHAPLIGAAGLQAFEGVTLAAGNKVVDRIGGAIGTPYGSPVGYSDRLQVVDGHA